MSSRLVRTLALLAVAIVAATAAACGGDDEPAASGEISFLIFGDPPEIAAYRKLIDTFQEAEPDVDVQLIEASDRDDLLARLATSFAGGSPPDLFLINYRYYGQFASKDVLEPLESYAEESDEFELADFYPQAMDAFRWNGELTCMAQNVSSLVVYYNKDLFEKYDVAFPRNGMPWTEFVHTAAQMTRDKQGLPVRGADPDAPLAGTVTPEIYGLGIEPVIIRLAPFIWSNGGDVVDDEENPTKLTFDTPQAMDAIREFFNLRSVHGVVPSDAEVESEDNESRFVNGRLAMLLQSRREVPSFREAAKFDWDVASLPTWERPAGILHSDAYCLTKASENKDAAWRFVEFALGPRGAPVVAETGRTVPSLRSVAESEAFLDPGKKPANSRAWLDSIEGIQSVPTIATWPEIEDAAEPILENGFYKGLPVEEVVADVQEATEPIFERTER
jgi:multiple sugar transport system substrate-binding protein